MKYAKVQQQKSLMRNSQAASAQTGKNGSIISDHRDSIPIQKKANKTGLPDNLKSGIENLSGMAMDHVKVHYNSAKPASLQAHAYAQGSDIHVAPGQEKHLPHEAWHIVQQAKGRVKPTMQLAGGVPVNDNAGLEKEADLMGARALQRVAVSDNKQAVQQEFSGIPNPPLHYDVTHQLKAINRTDLYPVQFSRTKKLWAKLKGGFGKGLDSLGWILGGGVGGYLGALASASIGLSSAGQLNDVPTVVGGMIGSYLGESLQKTYQTPYEEPHDIENPIIDENSALINN